MKKLSLAILLVGLSASFAKAQSTSEKSKAKKETETSAVIEAKANATVLAPAAEETAKVEAMKMDEEKMKKDTPAHVKQQVAVEQKEVKSSIE